MEQDDLAKPLQETSCFVAQRAHPRILGLPPALDLKDHQLTVASDFELDLGKRDSGTFEEGPQRPQTRLQGPVLGFVVGPLAKLHPGQLARLAFPGPDMKGPVAPSGIAVASAIEDEFEMAALSHGPVRLQGGHDRPTTGLHLVRVPLFQEGSHVPLMELLGQPI